MTGPSVWFIYRSDTKKWSTGDDVDNEWTIDINEAVCWGSDNIIIDCMIDLWNKFGIPAVAVEFVPKDPLPE